MPFDQFTIKQLAGDLLPEATPGRPYRHRIQSQPPHEQRGRCDPGGMAGGDGHRSGRDDLAGLDGPDDGLARCHDHKYDPITQKEFYRFFAIFNNVPETG